MPIAFFRGCRVETDGLNVRHPEVCGYQHFLQSKASGFGLDGGGRWRRHRPFGWFAAAAQQDGCGDESEREFCHQGFLSSTILDERKTVFRYRRYNSFDDEGLVQPVVLDSGQKSLVRDSQAIRGSGLVPLALAQRGFQFVALGLWLVRWPVGRRSRG